MPWVDRDRRDSRQGERRERQSYLPPVPCLCRLTNETQELLPRSFVAFEAGSELRPQRFARGCRVDTELAPSAGVVFTSSAQRGAELRVLRKTEVRNQAHRTPGT
jgi:hypothetical protein